MAERRKVGNLLALAILALLAQGQPMHPYEMATLLRRTGKEQDLNIKWGSFYTVVRNLEKYGFIQATGVDRDGGRPERTSYTITGAGRAELADWMGELLAVPDPEQTSFVAALSVLAVMPPDQVAALLSDRVRALEAEIAAARQVIDEAAATVPWLFLIEDDYALMMRQAELDWVRALLGQLTDGTLPGLAQWREFHQTGQVPEELMKLLTEGGPPED